MNKNSLIGQTNFPDLKLIKRGKVRDLYEVEDKLLIVATDRISAFDVIMNESIPYKGKVLTQISDFWFNFTSDIVKNHIISTKVTDYPKICQQYAEELEGRSMLVLKTEPLSIECIVRGYISGSGWKEYQKSKTICGINLSEGLLESDKLLVPIFTPSTKAEIGTHDENISFEKASEIIGEELAVTVKNISLMIYQKVHDYAFGKGIIIADTKMEFGLLNGELILIDELLTPDSSRFWPKDEYLPGRGQTSFDKQYLRDYLKSLNWNQEPPPPTLPDEVVKITSEKYLESLTILTGKVLE